MEDQSAPYRVEDRTTRARCYLMLGKSGSYLYLHPPGCDWEEEGSDEILDRCDCNKCGHKFLCLLLPERWWDLDDVIYSPVAQRCTDA